MEETPKILVLYFTDCLPFCSGAGSELNRFTVCCLDLFLSVVHRFFVEDWACGHICAKHTGFTKVLYRFLNGFLYMIDLEVFPRVPFTGFLLVVYWLVLPHVRSAQPVL